MMVNELRAKPPRRPPQRAGTPDPARPTKASDPANRRGRRILVLPIALLLAAVLAWRMVLGVARPVPPGYSLDALLYGSNVAAPADLKTLPVPDAAAVRRAQAALTSEPLNAEAFVVLALAADHAGRDDEAARLMGIAASLSPRELLAETWLMTRSLRRGDPAAAIGYFDTIARVRPETLDDFTGALIPLLRDPATADAFVDRLARSPPWRARFLSIAIRLWSDPEALIGLVDRLEKRRPGLDAVELRAFLSKLWATGLFDQAYLRWLKSLPQARLVGLSYLYNGGFQFPPTDTPLDWETPAVPGVQVSINAESEPRTLTVGFLGDQVYASPVMHDLVLAPGSYRLEGRVQTDRLDTPRGVRWKLACAETPDRTLGTSDLYRETISWRDFAVDFAVPDASCHAQALSLEVDGRTASEHEASGTIAFSQLAIQPR